MYHQIYHVSLNEDILSYDDEGFKTQLRKFMIEFYEKQLEQVQFKSCGYEEKFNLIEEFKDNIKKLKE